jgi:hypothetical protein
MGKELRQLCREPKGWIASYALCPALRCGWAWNAIKGAIHFYNINVLRKVH